MNFTGCHDASGIYSQVTIKTRLGGSRTYNLQITFIVDPRCTDIRYIRGESLENMDPIVHQGVANKPGGQTGPYTRLDQPPLT